MKTKWLLRNGSIIDGTGKPAVAGNVLVSGDRIEAVGKVERPADVQELDCSGLTITPGFIDAHSHSDLQVLDAGKREKLKQGVTTEVIGNCGFSADPPSPDPADLRQFANGIFCGDDSWGWPSTKAYLEAVEQSATMNVASLVGHGTLRIAVAGNRQGELPEPDLQRMESLLDEALMAGATGFSTGLMYAPGSSAPFSELERLCRVVAKHNKIYTTHMRSYFADLVPSIEEQIELARRTGCRLQISHLQAVGAANWPQHARALETIEKAKSEGVDIAFDCYPYIAGSTVLTQFLPQWALDGGAAAMLARLSDKSERAKITDGIRSNFSWRWSDIYISSVGGDDQSAVGRNLQELGDAAGCNPVDAMIDLLIAKQGNVNIISFNQSEDNLRLSLTHPLAIIISDGFYVKGRPHPRLHGTFPLLLGTMSRKRHWLTLEDAVHKITQRPAERFQMKGRGVLARGAMADITIFDAATVDSPATYQNPEAAPVGIRHVFRNGSPIADSF
jgi:N-acyl-D-amino-acid deacylase